jgi:hypothetical protein
MARCASTALADWSASKDEARAPRRTAHAIERDPARRSARPGAAALETHDRARRGRAGCPCSRIQSVKPRPGQAPSAGRRGRRGCSGRAAPCGLLKQSLRRPAPLAPENRRAASGVIEGEHVAHRPLRDDAPVVKAQGSGCRADFREFRSCDHHRRPFRLDGPLQMCGSAGRSLRRRWGRGPKSARQERMSGSSASARAMATRLVMPPGSRSKAVCPPSLRR